MPCPAPRRAIGPLLLTLVMPMLVAPAQAADVCDAPLQAAINAIQTPHHVTTTRVDARSGKATSAEAIFAGGVEYVKLRREWRRNAMPQQAMVEAAQEKLRAHSDICTVGGDR